MKDILKKLLERLEAIGENHEELFDSEVRGRTGDAIMEGFVRHRHDYIIPDDLGMFSDESNADVKSAIARYISDANQRADELGLRGFHERLSAMQDGSVLSAGRNYYDEFLGHSRPEFFDENGNVIRTR